MNKDGKFKTFAGRPLFRGYRGMGEIRG